MKRILLIVVFLMINCSRESSSIELQKPTPQSLAKNKNFIMLNSLISYYLNKRGNQNHRQPQLPDNEIKLYLGLGFKNKADFENFQNKIVYLNTQLSKDFDLSSLNDGAIKNVVYKANLQLEDMPPDDGSDDYCTQNYKVCFESAYSTYMLSTIGCIAGGVGISTGSAGWAIPVGGALAGACVAAAQVQYDANRKMCLLSYQQCKKNKAK